MADEIGRSKSWVKKWLHRIRNALLEDQTILFGKSHIRKHPPVSIDPKIVEKILEIRDQPPQGLGRIPGPLPILYYLQKDTELKTSNCRLPRSTRIIWRVLTQYQRIHHPMMSIAEPEERPDPGVEWGLDFHDVSAVPSDPDGK